MPINNQQNIKSSFNLTAPEALTVFLHVTASLMFVLLFLWHGSIRRSSLVLGPEAFSLCLLWRRDVSRGISDWLTSRLVPRSVFSVETEKQHHDSLFNVSQCWQKKQQLWFRESFRTEPSEETTASDSLRPEDQKYTSQNKMTVKEWLSDITAVPVSHRQ